MTYNVGFGCSSVTAIYVSVRNRVVELERARTGSEHGCGYRNNNNKSNTIIIIIIIIIMIIILIIIIIDNNNINNNNNNI